MRGKNPFWPKYQTTIRHVKGERVTPIEESKSEKIGGKHIFMDIRGMRLAHPIPDGESMLTIIQRYVVI